MTLIPIMIIFIGATLSKAAIGFISRRTLDSYNVEFWIGIVKKIIESRLVFPVVSHFLL
jgi:hypothetical protein